jgi:tetratricopeptide (TPR) repeat protein
MNTGRLSSRATFALCALLALAAASRSFAESEAGRAEFESAARRFKAQDYKGALEDFEKAYRLSNHRASSIRGLAQCERALELYDRAISHFKEYLETNPADGPSIKETIKLLELEKEKAEAAAQKAAPPPPPTPLAEPNPVVATTPAPAAQEEGSMLSSPVFWIVAGAVVVVGGGIAAAALLSKTPDPSGGSTGVLLKPLTGTH